MTSKKRSDKTAVNIGGVATRRSFLNRVWAGLTLLALAEVLWVVASFLSRRKTKMGKVNPGYRVECGPVAAFATASVTAFPMGQFYLVRLEDGGFLALSRRCTHLGCTVPWNKEDKKFQCPCHASAFDITGSAIAAPAVRALDLFAVSIENDTVVVDTGRRTRRNAHRAEQVTYAGIAVKKEKF